MSLPLEGSRDTDEGILVSIYPDVCLTPCGSTMVPVPYTIWAKQSDDANTTPTVRFTSLRTHNMGSLITTCHGDEAGTGGGVNSGTHNGICESLEHSRNVRTEGKNAIRHNDIWCMNNKNTQGRLTYVKESDNTSLTPQSQQEWTHNGRLAATGSDDGRVMSDANPDTVVAGQMYAQALPNPIYAPAPTPPTTPLPPVTAPPSSNVIPFPSPQGAASSGTAEVGADAGLIETSPAAGEGVGISTGFLASAASILALAGVALLGMTSSTGGRRRADGSYDDERPREERKEKLAPLARTYGNCNISDNGQKPPCPCTVAEYSKMSKTCKDCGAQAHHILPDYMLRYGTRSEGIAGEKRIAGADGKTLLDYSDGPSICMKGGAKDKGTEHNTAHECDAAVAEQGAAAEVKGTINAGAAIDLSATAAKVARPDCGPQIDAAMNGLKQKLGEDTLLRATQRLPSPGSPAADHFSAPVEKF